MSATQVPAVIDQLVTRMTERLAENPAVTVYDGFGTSGNQGDFLMIGIDDPTSSRAGLSGTSDQSDGPMGTDRPRDERGAVLCAAYSVNGNGGNAGQKAARDAVYGYLAEVEALLREVPELGIGFVTTPYFKAQMGDSRLSQNQNESGADALLVFTVRFFARI